MLQRFTVEHESIYFLMSFCCSHLRNPLEPVLDKQHLLLIPGNALDLRPEQRS